MKADISLWESMSLVDEATELHPLCMGLESRKADRSPGGWLSMACWCPIPQQTVGTAVLVPGAQEVPPHRGQLKGHRNEQRVLLRWRSLESPTSILLSGVTHSACAPEGSQI